MVFWEVDTGVDRPNCEVLNEWRTLDLPIMPPVPVSFRTFPHNTGLPLFSVPVVMRVFHTYSPCLEESGA